MENPLFVSNENIPLVTYHDLDYEGDHDDEDDCNTSNTSKRNEATFGTPSSTDKHAASTLRLRQQVKRDELSAL